jgi:hypothetical protein
MVANVVAMLVAPILPLVAVLNAAGQILNIFAAFALTALADVTPPLATALAASNVAAALATLTDAPAVPSAPICDRTAIAAGSTPVPGSSADTWPRGPRRNLAAAGTASPAEAVCSTGAILQERSGRPARQRSARDPCCRAAWPG